MAGKKFYSQTEDGGIEFQTTRKVGDVRIPNYVYDMWMPLIGSDAIGVYGTYCRLEREGKVRGMKLADLAKACRIGLGKLKKINNMLEDCGFISIEKPDGKKRLMHWTTEITTHDPAQIIAQELVDKYAQDSGYQVLCPWLMDEFKTQMDFPGNPNGLPGGSKESLHENPNGSSNIESFILNPSKEVEVLNSFDSLFPEPSDHSQDGLPLATDTHQREIEKSLGNGAGSDPLEEIAKHLCWGIRGLGAQLPQAKKNRNTWLNAARLLLDETNAAGEWIAVCDAIDEWFKDPPKADQWSRDNAKKPHDPVPAIARYYSRQAASARQTTPGKVNGAAGFALEVFTGPVPERRQLSEIEQTWQDICEILRLGLAPATFNQLIRPCRLEKPNGVYQIISPENNIGWLENRLKSQIIKAIEYVAGAGAKVEILAQ